MNALSDRPAGTARPELVLQPYATFSLQDVLDVWRCRELLVMLALRDVRLRYRQAALGVAWALLQPLTQMVIFTILFNRFAGIRSEGDLPYPVFSFSGLVVWALFANGLSYASESLVQSASLITKVYFPRLIIPLAAIFATIVDFLISSTLLAVLMVVYGVPFHPSGLLALPIAALAALCAAAIGLWTSALNVQFRDVRHALPFFIQLLVFLTPVFYSASLVPSRYRPLLALNPMAAVIEGFRAALFGTPLPWARLALALAAALLLALSGFFWFRRVERTFADRI
jgi:lipopolysaccharide transport system permease protein